jgi:dolichyl-phosphate mannosyltransferase polypeptide 2 regulatory subunit
VHPKQLDKLIGFAMLAAASVVFLYYSIWALLMVRFCRPSRSTSLPDHML